MKTRNRIFSGVLCGASSGLCIINPTNGATVQVRITADSTAEEGPERATVKTHVP